MVQTNVDPIPQLKLGYEKKTTPGRRKLMRHEPESKKRKLIQEVSGAGIYSGDTVSTSSGHKTEHLPEAICEFNVLEPSRWSHICKTIDWQPDYVYTDKNILHGWKGCSSYDWNRYDVGKRQYSDRLCVL